MQELRGTTLEALPDEEHLDRVPRGHKSLEEKMQCPNCGSFGVDSGELDYAVCRTCGYNWTPSVEPDWNGELVVRKKIATEPSRHRERNLMSPDRSGEGDDYDDDDDYDDEEEDLEQGEEDFEDDDDFDDDFDDEADDF